MIVVNANKARLRNVNQESPLQTDETMIIQQQETRKDIIAKKQTVERRKWLVDIESRIKVNDTARILVVDDTESDRYSLIELILDSCVDPIIDEASDGLQAFEMVQTNYFEGKKYDVIFMDMNMVICDGSASIAMIRGFEKRNKISALCNICAVSADDFEETNVLDSTTTDIFKLKKPISKTILSRKLKKLNLI